MSKPNLHIVLIEPEIPNNTGNIGRTCVGTESSLHLVEPLGFEISDSKLKRAGLDYWGSLRLHRHKNLDAWKSTIADWSRVFFFSTKATKSLYEVQFLPEDVLVFGKETKGLDPSLIDANLDRTLCIPQPGPVRSLNLATAVAIANYEALRQIKYQK